MFTRVYLSAECSQNMRVVFLHKLKQFSTIARLDSRLRWSLQLEGTRLRAIGSINSNRGKPI